MGPTSRRLTRSCAVAASAGAAVPGRRCWQREQPPSARQPAGAAPEASQNQRPGSQPDPGWTNWFIVLREVAPTAVRGNQHSARRRVRWPPRYGAGSGEELVAEVVIDAGDVGAHDDGLVVVQVEAEEGLSGGLAVLPGDRLATVVAGDLATVVAGDLGPYVVAMRSCPLFSRSKNSE
jgi:hypothetical protein